MPTLPPVQIALLIVGVLLATLILGSLLAILMAWLTREVQAAYGQAPATTAKAPTPATEVAAVPEVPAQRIGPWPFVISGLALLVVLAVIFYPMPQPQTASPETPSGGKRGIVDPGLPAGGGCASGEPGEGQAAVPGHMCLVSRAGRQRIARPGEESDHERLRAAADRCPAAGVHQEGAAGDGSGQHHGGGYAAERGQPGFDRSGSGRHHRLHPHLQSASAVAPGSVRGGRDPSGRGRALAVRLS